MVTVEVPPEFPNKIADPPVVRLLPAVSFAVRVKRTELPDETVPALIVTTEVPTAMGPGITVRVGNVEVSATPPTVPVIVVALPAVTPVKEAE